MFVGLMSVIMIWFCGLLCVVALLTASFMSVVSIRYVFNAVMQSGFEYVKSIEYSFMKVVYKSQSVLLVEVLFDLFLYCRVGELSVNRTGT